MSIHKLTAGSGYDYLTRQVAALDATQKGHVGLASYYTERGETPGVWIGTGMAGIDGLNAGDVVTAEQMRALFGSGLHPLAAQRVNELAGPDLTEADFQEVMRLGAPFKVYANDISPFRLEVAKRIADVNTTDGLPGDWPVPPSERARIRSQVGREMFRAEHSRDPFDARELAGAIATYSRPQTRAVAGYDLTFSPVKSVSALWAVAEPSVAARIERAHQAAIADALRFIETQALFTRTGTNGVRQVDVHGLVATAFTHRDSRAGDPDLHTHVAVANKVQTLDGRWLSIDGRILFKATVAASETYNTALERHLTNALGVRFVERPNLDPRLRPVREIDGIDPRLNERWSARRAIIDVRRHELAADFQAAHGRPPTPVEMLQLAQQANLETRHAKHEPRSLTEQRATWQAEAEQVLGSPAAVASMVRTALNPTREQLPPVGAGQVEEAVSRVVAVMESSRSTWQMWHVRAEAQRQVRALNPDTDQVGPLVELITTQVLHDRSVSLARPSDGVDEPALLRRIDGTSVYTVAGADLYTSTKILQAEQRLVATAGQSDGQKITGSLVDLALLEATANGVTLNPGQAALVRAMCTSGDRLQLAIAPAGAGKTTALQALTAAWTAGGGTVIGLAPSASAAAQLRDQAGARTDTLAKLTWSIHHNDLPDWAQTIGPSTLVVIDEAGMADTLSLDTAVSFVTGRGGSVRLVGDDQQLAAIGAGGVLRDIQHTHGAVRLTELLRFTDPAEAVATLALRDGRPEALGFYLDNQRVHVGDLAGLTEDIFAAWQNDRNQGLDSIMLAPTRDLAAQLNHRARTHRLHQPRHTRPEREVVLADGNQASAGDTVTTRSNNRALRVSSSDWVKNGDRWTIQAVGHDGSLRVRHTRHGRSVWLPADYVKVSVELGYATTVHTAQGVSVDTMHGLASGEETRQQLYTMMTRGRTTNHLYLQVVGDGDPHTVIRPDLIHPVTATDVLEQILANDQAAESASTLQREQHDPAVRLGDAAARYVDALYVAAEDLAGPEIVAALEHSAEQMVPGLTKDAAWPTLRAHLILLAAHGADPVTQLAAAAGSRELNTADDEAAVLDWRLDDTGLRNANPGPLPWIPGIPTALRHHHAWGPYLASRADLVTQLADQVRTQAQETSDRPKWARHGAPAIAPTAVIAEVEVWRAATQVQPGDQRLTGPVQQQKTSRAWQQHLDHALTAGQQPALNLWGPLIQNASRSVRTDTFLPVLADRLAALDRAGIDARPALYTAITAGPLPDDHAAAALWWRITRHLPPTLVAQVTDGRPVSTGWSGTNPATPTDDPWSNLKPATDQDHSITAGDDPPTPSQPPARAIDQSVDEDRWLEPDLAIAALVRDTAGALEPTDADTTRQWERILAWRESPVSRERMLEINQLTLGYYRNQYPGSWGQTYLTQRFGGDLTGDDRFQPGHAPAGWTNLVTHLHRHGVTDQEMTTAGVATTASTGRLIDRFRDRVILPITSQNNEILGFVGRRHPDHNDADRHGPKYLNTPDTPLFHKGAQLYGAHLIDTDTNHQSYALTPVIAEGPMDAIAVTLAGHGRYIGVAPLGTSLTDEQATQLAQTGVDPVVATDADLAGQVAAERDYWILTPHRLDPTHAQLPAGSDPADLFSRHGQQTLNEVLDRARPLADTLIEERLTNLPTDQAVTEATRVAAARPAQHWNRDSDIISARVHLPHDHVRRELLGHVKAWNADPREAARRGLQNVQGVKTRLAAAQQASPANRWAGLANQLDRRLISESDWPALANLIQHAHDAGYDVATTTRQLVADEPLNSLPAQDLRYRLVGRLNLNPFPAVSADTATPPNRTRPTENRRNQPRSPNTTPDISR